MPQYNVYYMNKATKRLVRLAPFAMTEETAIKAAIDFCARNHNNPRYAEPFIARH